MRDETKEELSAMIKEATDYAYQQGVQDGQMLRNNNDFESAFAAAQAVKRFCAKCDCRKCGFADYIGTGYECQLSNRPYMWFEEA